MRISRAVGLSSALVALSLLAFSQSGWSQQKQANDDEDGIEVLTRGPIHEAFAQPVAFDAKAGLVIAKAPPDPIQEVPPDEKVEGDNVVWIPGYWAWDDDRNDFIWVSGTWRAIPPSRQWIPGYWHQTQGGYQWVPGYWASAGETEVTYQPQPPESLEEGPSTPAPSEEHTWAPGVWVWTTNTYSWRPGFWLAPQVGWTYTPACYHWTPSGYVFVDSYYDYEPYRRGLIYSPVFFRAGIWARPGWSFRPRYGLWWGGVVNNFFARPFYNHYYFGDWYAGSYLRGGIYPWFSFHNSRWGYDPIYAYNRAYFGRRDPGWANRVQADFRRRRDNERERPPANFADLRARQKTGDINVNNQVTVQPINELSQTLANNNQNNIRLTKLNEESRQRIADHSKALQKQRQLRAQGEVEAKGGAKTGQPVKRQMAPAAIVSAKGQDKVPNVPKAPATQDAPKGKSGKVTRESPEDRLQGKEAEPKAKTPEEPKAKTPEPKAKTPEQPKAKTPEPKAKTPEQPKAKAPEPKAKTPEQPKAKTPEPKTPEPPKAKTPEQPKAKTPEPKAKAPEPKATPKSVLDRTPPKAPEPKAAPKSDRSPPKAPEPKAAPKSVLERNPPKAPAPRAPEPKAAPKSVLERTPPKAAPRAEPKAAPQVERTPPKVDRDPEPRVRDIEPKANPQPRANPPAPRAQPKANPPAPRAQPRANPGPRNQPAKDQRKGKGREE